MLGFRGLFRRLGGEVADSGIREVGGEMSGERHVARAQLVLLKVGCLVAEVSFEEL
jgi:hypothetical protein